MSRKSPLPLSRSSRGILHAAGVPAATWTPAESVLKEEEATLLSERMVQQVVAAAADGARRLVRLVVQVMLFLIYHVTGNFTNLILFLMKIIRWHEAPKGLAFLNVSAAVRVA